MATAASSTTAVLSIPPPTFTFSTHLHNILPTLGAPSKTHRPLCQDFLASNGTACPRDPNCPDRHYIPVADRSGVGHLICKHYQRGLCKKSQGGTCDFAHTFNLRDERECKEFSRYGICAQGEECTSLHVAGPGSEARRQACPHYARGFCPLGPVCALRHVKHEKFCPYYMAGFCPNGRGHPPGTDRVVSCEFGAHARWTRDEDLNPKKPEVRKEIDPEVARREQEEREDEFFAEEERRRERFERDGGRGGWRGRGGGGFRGGGRGRGRGRY